MKSKYLSKLLNDLFSFVSEATTTEKKSEIFTYTKTTKCNQSFNPLKKLEKNKCLL